MTVYRYPSEKPGVAVSELLRRRGVDLDMPCGGNHSCGKCLVKAAGGITPPSRAELYLLGDAAAGGLRLACMAQSAGDAEILVETLVDTTPTILTDTTANVGRVLNPMMARDRYGVAVDIGTTTVVVALYGGAHTTQLASVSELNRQRRFGADVISRIHYGITNSNQEVHEVIRDQLEDMIGSACAMASVPRLALTHAVVTGNTTMMHFFAGLDPRGIGSAPFIPESLFGDSRSDLLAGISCYIPPCIASYAGADLVCCMLAAEILEHRQDCALIDIGTNGEMSLFYGGALHACSTAAGPAFEGAGISHGSPARVGAISKVSYATDWALPSWRTIGDVKATGICGSGLVDAIALLVGQRAVKTNGRLLTEGHALAPYIHDGDSGLCFRFPGTTIEITQHDVRQVQLAKGAIYAGLVTLLQTAGIEARDLDALYLCGGFGSYLDLAAAEVIGLIPWGLRGRTVSLSNGALSGAAMILLDHDNIERARVIRDACAYLELSADARFMKNYVEAIHFEV